jgi:hypothetical protein
MFKKFFVLMMFSPFLFAEPGTKKWLTDWATVKAEGVDSAKCRTHMSNIEECEFEAYTTASPEELLKLNITPDALPKFMANVISADKVEDVSDREYVLYMKWNFPGAINRDSVTRANHSLSADKKVARLDFRTDKHGSKPEDFSFVRFKAIKGYWLFERQPDSRTKITYRSIALPGGVVESVLYDFYNIATLEASALTVKKLIDQAETVLAQK